MVRYNMCANSYQLFGESLTERYPSIHNLMQPAVFLVSLNETVGGLQEFHVILPDPPGQIFFCQQRG